VSRPKFLRNLPGAQELSDEFCNRPVRVEQVWDDAMWDDQPVAVVLLCGRLHGHIGDCDPTPPISDITEDVPASADEIHDWLISDEPEEPAPSLVEAARRYKELVQEPCVTEWAGRMVTSYCDQCRHGLLAHTENRYCELCRIIGTAKQAPK
jgi:hypothetical protein